MEWWNEGEGMTEHTKGDRYTSALRQLKSF